jgi:hypothetical protein
MVVLLIALQRFLSLVLLGMLSHPTTLMRTRRFSMIETMLVLFVVAVAEVLVAIETSYVAGALPAHSHIYYVTQK